MAQITGVNKNALKLLLVIALVAGGIFAGKKFYLDAPKTVKESQILAGKTALPDEPDASLSGASAIKLELPTEKVAKTTGTKIDWDVMAWNSQMGLMYANGSDVTMVNSLIEAANLSIHIKRQDDCEKAYKDVIAFSQAYSKDKNTTAVFATFMGDGMPTYMTNIYNGIKALGLDSNDYAPVIIGTFGQSYGEDQLMAPKSWKDNPKNALGGVVACVIGDGDMNVMLNWAQDNNLKVNPDPKTYDSSAINLMDAGSDFIHAVELYNTSAEVEVKVAKNGKTTGQLIKIKATAVATWTPGDVAIVEGKGGLVTIVSTHDYATQMPNMTVTCKKWADEHQSEVEKLFVALGKGGDQVKSFSDAKLFAAQVSAKVYGSKDAKFWAKYYDGVDYDANTHLGGSRVYNLSDMRNTFGLGTDGVDRYGKVYERFGGFLKQLYPELLANYYPYNASVKYAKSILRSIEDNQLDTLALKGKSFEIKYAEGKIKSRVSSKNYQIKFRTGSADIEPSSIASLQEILSSSTVAEGLKLEIYGHTDDVGDAGKNLRLSQSRAEAIRQYLVKHGVSETRISNVKGLGDELPFNCADPRSGDNPNRRVVNITLGN